VAGIVVSILSILSIHAWMPNSFRDWHTTWPKPEQRTENGEHQDHRVRVEAHNLQLQASVNGFYQLPSTIYRTASCGDP